MKSNKLSIFKTIATTKSPSLEDQHPAGQTPQRASFSLMTYNILANSLCTPDWFKYVKDVKYLDPVYRQKMLVADLRELQADVICLQECEKEVIDDIGEKLVDKKYQAIWVQRNSGKVDGLATLFNLEKFKLEGAKKIDLDEAFEALGITHEMYPDAARKKHKLGLITHLSLVQSP